MKNNLFNEELKVLNIGLKSLSESLKNKTKFLNLDYPSPFYDDGKSWEKINKNLNKIKKANNKVLNIISNSLPFLVDVDKIKNLIPKTNKYIIFYSGDLNNILNKKKKRLYQVLIYEGLAKNEKEALKIIKSGKIKFFNCNDYNLIISENEILSYSMSVFVIRNEFYKNFAYTTLNNFYLNPSKLNYIEHLKWLENIFYPIMKEAIEKRKINLKEIIKEAVSMGDDLHNKNKAINLVLKNIFNKIILNNVKDIKKTIQVLEFINKNDNLFFNLFKASSKVILDKTLNIKYSSLVYMMKKEESKFIIKISGIKNKNFSYKLNPLNNLSNNILINENNDNFFDDDPILESNGLGIFLFDDKMYKITMCNNNFYKVPLLNFKSSPVAIDLIKVIKNSITPLVYLKKDKAISIVNLPKKPFIDAFKCFLKEI